MERLDLREAFACQTNGWATLRAQRFGVTCTIEWKDRWWRRFKQLSWTIGSRHALRFWMVLITLAKIGAPVNWQRNASKAVRRTALKMRGWATCCPLPRRR